MLNHLAMNVFANKFVAEWLEAPGIRIALLGKEAVSSLFTLKVSLA